MTNGGAPSSRVIRMRKRLLVLMSGRGSSSAQIQRAKMIEIDVLLPFYYECRKKKGKKKKKSMIISIDFSEEVGVITVHNNGPAV